MIKFKQPLSVFFLFSTFFLMIRCNNGRVVEVVDNHHQRPAENTAEQQPVRSEVHQFEVLEVLQAEKYTYLKAKEGDEEYWVAIAKNEVSVGQKFSFEGGLLKTNFYSRDFSRNFDKVYLVGRLIPIGGGAAMGQSSETSREVQRINVQPSASAIPIKDLITSKEKYQGQVVEVTGQCVKVNNMIMNRNWVHLQDGTEINGQKVDLTVTTAERINVGDVMTMKGTIVLNQNFGSGYFYEVLMEKASIVQQ